MDSPQTAVTGQREGDERRLVLTSITFDLSNPSSGELAPSNLTEFWIFVEGGPEEGTCCPLDRDSPQRWTVNGSIQFSPGVTEMQCVVKDQEEQDVGFVHLQSDELQMTGGTTYDYWLRYSQSDKGQFTTEHVRDMIIPAGSSLALTMCWEVAERPPYAHVQFQVDTTPLEAPSRIQISGDLAGLEIVGAMFLLHFQHSGDITDLDNSISLLQGVVQETPTGAVALPALLHNLTTALGKRFDLTEDLSDLTEAITIARRIFELAPNGYPIPSVQLQQRRNLGVLLRARFDRSGDLTDLVDAISEFKRAIKLTPESDSVVLLALLRDLEESLMSRFERTDNLVDLDETILIQQRRINLSPEQYADLPIQLHNLCSSFSRRYHRTRNLNDVSEAISVQRRLVGLAREGHEDLPSRPSNRDTPEGHANLPNLPTRLVHLAELLGLRFEHLKNPSDVSEAIPLLQRAVDLTAKGDPKLPDRISEVGRFLLFRFGYTRDPHDLNGAIAAQQEAVGLTQEGHPSLPKFLNFLGTSFSRRFSHVKDLTDIANAVSAHERAVQLMPDDDPYLPAWLDALGNAYLEQTMQVGDLDSVNEAISTLERAIQLTPDGHVDLPSRLNSLGTFFRERFALTSDVSDISRAILAQQKAVQLAAEGHPKAPDYLSDLRLSYATRFYHTGQLPDLKEVLPVRERAIFANPLVYATRHISTWLCALTANIYGQPCDLANSIAAERRDIRLQPHGHASLPGRFAFLGLLLQSRFVEASQLSDINEAIDAYRNAIQLIRQDCSLPCIFKFQLFNMLGGALFARSVVLRGLPDVNEAISALERSLQLTSIKGHDNIFLCLELLGHCYCHRSNITGNLEDLDASIQSYKRAVSCDVSRLNQKARVARLWANALLELRRGPDEILSAFSFAIEFASQTAGLEQTVQSRFSQTEDVSSITLEGAAAACQLGEPVKAVEWLEQGRCIVWSQLNSLRAPLDDLRAHDSQLARRLMDVSKKLEKTGSTRQVSSLAMDMSTKILLEDEARSHLALAREWDELVSTVRAVPEFKFFLKPSRWADLTEHLPSSGPIVVINIHESRCDAIALLAGLEKPLHIPLPNFSHEKAIEYRGALRAQLEFGSVRMREGHCEATEEGPRRRALTRWKPKSDQIGIKVVLRGLWWEVAKPILESLGYLRLDPSSKSRPPRIWWCPTGVMSFLPIHAAGVYEVGESDSVLDYAVSSYTPTITALADRVKNCCPIDKAVSGLFLTGHPKAPGVCEIGGTISEVDGIQNQAVGESVRVLKVVGDDLTLHDCLKHMRDFSSVHLACHASQNAADPLQSRFILHNGQLNLIDIIQMDLKNADLAFLSACQTSTGEEKLSDEAVHLAAGMLAAGYRRVVATMWPINDSYAPTVANDFYEYLWRDREEGEDGFDGSLSAYALHHAVQQLRQRLDESEASLLAWVPYVHFGY